MPKQRRKRSLSWEEKMENKLRYNELKRKRLSGEFVPTPIPQKNKEIALERYGYACAFCLYEGKRETGESLQIDHDNPEAEGGTHDPDNLRPLCPRHHGFVGEKRTYDPLKRIDDMFMELERSPESLEFDPAFSSLYLPEAQLRIGRRKGYG